MTNTYFTKIIKRNGKNVKFSFDKLIQALNKAGKATNEFDESIAKKLATKTIRMVHSTVEDRYPTVEDVQDCMEEVLLGSTYKETAKACIIYREQHKQLREITNKFNSSIVNDYLKKTDWKVSENSNQGFSLQGLNNYVSSEITKTYWLNKIYPKEIREAHNKGEMHIHDLSYLSSYCVGHDLYDLLLSGFTGVSYKTESNPAKHLSTILGQIINFFYTLQGETAGAQAFSSFDTLLAPFIRYDKLTNKDVKQALQEFIFNMNVPTRTGFQAPFTNVTLDLNVSPNYKNTPVLIGGVVQKETYGEFQKEMDMFNKAFFEVMLEGDGNGKIFSFPIPTYNITKDFDWDNKNLEGLWEMTSKYGTPYFSNFINSDMKPEDARSMCCRLRLDKRQLEKRGGGLFGANPLTGSIGVVTINLPRIAYQSNNKKEFFEKLDRLMFLAKESLEIKRKIIEKFTENDLYPYTKFYIRSVKERFNEYWKNHFSTIGLIGMNEACLNFLKEDIGSENGINFAKETLDFMRDKLLEFQKETGNNYNLEATPAESTAYKLALLDKEEFGDILIANNEEYKKGAEPYYTNSTQLPVGYSDSMVDVLDLQDSIQTKYTGGCIEENSLVMTDTGLTKIKEIVNNKNRKVYSFNEKTMKTELKNIKDAFYINVEEKDKLQLELEGNNKIITSSWHPFYILDENLNIITKRADELKINDFVISITNSIKPKNETYIDADIAWLYGEFITDGYVNKSYVSFHSHNKDTIKKIENIIKLNFGEVYNKYKNREIRICKKDVRDKIKKMLYITKEEAKTFNCSLHPDTLNFNYESKVALLSGIIDGDGNVPIGGKYIRICSASFNFVLSLVSLIYSLGLTASYSKNKDNLYYVFIRKEQYSKILDSLKNHLTYKNKIKRLKKYSNSNGKKGILCNQKNKDLAKYSYKTGKYKTKNKISLTLAKQINPKLKEISGYFVNKISKPKIKTKFCDLTVEGNNNYLAGNNALVFIHNTVLHLFIGESRPSNESIKNLVKKICSNYKLPYFTITPTFSSCPSHGYIFGEFPICPQCGTECEVYSRVVGYFRPTSQWNKGKQQEFKDRKLFKMEN